MEPLKVNAIAVRTVPYGESDVIVTLISVEKGKITATARGCLKPKAKLRYSALPFNFGEYVLNGNGNRYIITECNQIEAFSDITADLDRYYAGCFVLNSLEKMSNEPNAELFLLSLNTLKSLAYEKDASAQGIISGYLLSVLKLNGTVLDFKECNVCGEKIDSVAYFSEKDGLKCKNCRREVGDVFIDAETVKYLSGGETTPFIQQRANVLLVNIIYLMLGVKLNSRLIAS